MKSATTMAMAKKCMHNQNLKKFKHAVSLKIPISQQVANAIRITRLTFSKLRKEDYDAEIETVKGVNVSNNAAILQLSSTFNKMFYCKVKQVGASRNYLQVHFIIKTIQPLG